MFVQKTLKTQAELDFFSNGTQDQRGFATDIRKAFLSDADDYRSGISKKEMLPAYDKAVEAVAANTDAIWWINNKSTPAKAMVLPELKKYI